MPPHPPWGCDPTAPTATVVGRRSHTAQKAAGHFYSGAHGRGRTQGPQDCFVDSGMPRSRLSWWMHHEVRHFIKGWGNPRTPYSCCEDAMAFSWPLTLDRGVMEWDGANPRTPLCAPLVGGGCGLSSEAVQRASLPSPIVMNASRKKKGNKDLLCLGCLDIVLPLETEVRPRGSMY